ncbi:MAG TPA: rhomboid family intramembrane serine protease [Gemmataceae bacterium]|nr:rhomboid family intramembrane serine protease [Gemmataceae bacterium]
MVLPLWDDNSDRRTFPYVNYALIGLNVFVFVVLQQFGSNDQVTYAFACVPAEIVQGRILETPPQAVEDPVTGDKILVPGLQPMPLPLPDPFAAWITLLTSMFLHGGIAHIAGNMLFLWIFGDNVEDHLGHVRYVFFYLVCGVLASLAHVVATYAFDQDPMIPSLGASGAISGVLGGYLLLFPYRRVTVLLFRFLTQVPAWVAVGMWFVFQIVSGIGALGPGSQAGGVAYAAHVGGFVVGLALVKVFALGRDADTWPTARPPRYRDRRSYS